MLKRSAFRRTHHHDCISGSRRVHPRSSYQQSSVERRAYFHCGLCRLFDRGPVGKAVKIVSYADFEGAFGVLHARNEASLCHPVHGEFAGVRGGFARDLGAFARFRG